MPFISLDPEATAVVRAMAGRKADGYIGEVLLPALSNSLRAESSNLKDIRAAFSNPFQCTNAFFQKYAFARRGKDRDELGQIASMALKRIASEDTFTEVLKLPDGQILWESFSQVCEERKRKNIEQLNRGIIAGILELAQEIYRLDGVGSMSEWISKGVMRTDHVESQFLRIVDIRGVGPKTTSTFLRDTVWLFGLEEQIDHADRLYVQPVDRWLRMAAELIVPEFEDHDAADWVIAGKLAKYTRRAGVSGIRFNMGVTYFGMKDVREVSRFGKIIRELLEAPATGNSSFQEQYASPQASS